MYRERSEEEEEEVMSLEEYFGHGLCEVKSLAFSYDFRSTHEI
jgi:hypothetical protein